MEMKTVAIKEKIEEIFLSILRERKHLLAGIGLIRGRPENFCKLPKSILEGRVYVNSEAMSYEPNDSN